MTERGNFPKQTPTPQTIPQKDGNYPRPAPTRPPEPKK